MSRIICISNRVSLPDPETGQIKAGGLAVGVKAAMKCNGGGIWFGWDGSILEPGDTKRTIKRTEKDGITFLTLPLLQEEYDSYYKAMANENLWPLLHGLDDHIEGRRHTFATYRQVNKLFAQLIKPYLQADDLIWVHDYHLMPLGKELRAIGVNNRIGYYHHIPMPSQEFLEKSSVPEFLKNRYQQLMADLFHYDLVGFQSFRDFKNFKTCLNADTQDPVRYKAKAMRHKGNKAHFGIFPISIETHEIVSHANRNAAKYPAKKNGCKTLIGAERLDYTKGLPYRLIGYHEFLDCHPEYWGKVQYQQITPLSRADIQQYKTAIEDTRFAAHEIEEDFSNVKIPPLIYSEEGVPREELISKMRHSDVGLVTPLIDGQNLVAKEYIAAQDPNDPGVLVLSKYAGAAEELESLGALCVEPCDPADIADKLDQALNLPLEERLKRYNAAISHLYEFDIGHWADSFLGELQGLKKEQMFPDFYNMQSIKTIPAQYG